MVYNAEKKIYKQIDKQYMDAGGPGIPDGVTCLKVHSSNPKCVSNNYPTNILNELLTPGQIYVLSYKAAADYDIGFYHNHFDVNFYTIPLAKKRNRDKRFYPPYLRTDSVVYENWQRLDYVFKADSAYKYMMVGATGSIRYYTYENNENGGGCSKYMIDDFHLYNIDILFKGETIQFTENDSLDFDSKKLISDMSQ